MNPEVAALVAQVHREDRDAWEREVEAEHDPTVRGREVIVVGGRKYAKGTTGTTFWSGPRRQYNRWAPPAMIVGVHPSADPEAVMWIEARWLRVIDTCEPSLAEYTSTDDEALAIVNDMRATYGPYAAPEHLPNPNGYGPHPGGCPACLADEAKGTPYTCSPRSETYWSS